METIRLLQSLTSFFLFLVGFLTAFSANIYMSHVIVSCTCKVEFSCQFGEDVTDEGNLIPCDAPIPSPWLPASSRDKKTSPFHRSRHKWSLRPVSESEQHLRAWSNVQSSSGVPSEIDMSERETGGDFKPTRITVSPSSKQFTCPAPVRPSEIFRRVSWMVFHIIGRGTSSKQHRSGCF